MPRTRCDWCSSPWATRGVALGLLLVLACAGDGPTGLKVREEANGTEVTLALGAFLDVVLGNVGPGTYASPPDITGAALAFEGVEVVPPYLPSGPTQRFRFKAIARGAAKVTLAKTDNVGVVHAAAYVLDVVVH